MKRLLLTIPIAAVFALTLLATPSEAEARWRLRIGHRCCPPPVCCACEPAMEDQAPKMTPTGGQRFTIVDTKIGVLLIDQAEMKIYRWDGIDKWVKLSTLPINE